MIVKMKIIDSFGLLLVTGILSTAAAQKQVRNPRESFQRSFDSSETQDIMGALHPGLEDFLRPKCEKNGGPKAYDMFIQSRQDLIKCVQSVAETLTSEELTSRTNVGMENTFKKMCSKVPDFKHCIDRSREPMAICFDARDRNSSRIINNVIIAVLDFLCADNARHITEFLEDNGPVCLMSKRAASMKCLDQLLSEVSELKSHNTAGSVFGIEQCTIYQNLQHCYVGVLKECRQQSPSNLVNSLFNVALQQTPCKHLLKSSSTRIHILSTTSFMGIVMSMLLI